MSTNNKFTVDLGKLTLSDDQSRRINAAIQSAVTKELGALALPENLALVPVFHYRKGPIINGIIAWEEDHLMQRAQENIEL